MDFPEEHPTIVVRALLFIYEGNFLDDPDLDYSSICRPRSVPGEPFFERDSDPQASTALDISFLTYAFAKQYGLEGLKAAAQNRFMSRAVEHSTTDEFRQALRRIYENTSRDAEGLRLGVTRLCVMRREDVQQDPELLGIVQQHEPMAFQCGIQIFELIQENDWCARHAKEIRNLQRSWERLTDIINRETGCCKCGARWGAKIQERMLSDGHDVLCKDCGYKRV